MFGFQKKLQTISKKYRSKDGSFDFEFTFVPEGDHLAIYCRKHPPHQQDPSPHRTHLFPSGKICFVAGKEPRTQARAEELAAQWSEYFIEYSKSGIAQH